MSNCWSLSGIATEIPNNSDMNTYMTPGNFMCATNNSVKTLKNCPVDNAFMLKVSSPINSKNYVIQEYIDLAGRQVIRSYSAYDKTWVEKRNATKDDLGVFLTTSGTKAAVFKGYVEITNLKLYAGHTYLVLGKTGSSINVSLISARIASPSSEYGSAFNFLESRTTGSNGGGCVTAAIITLTKDYTVTLQGYGYDNATYDYSGSLMAIQLK